MDIRGMQKFTLVDYPGKLAAVIFCGRCNFRCPYCHNPCLVLDPESQPAISSAELERFLVRRQGKLDGVVISGGEPTLQPDLPEVAARIRRLGFAVKLDTNGSNPAMVRRLIEQDSLQALGVDYKAPRARYAEISGCRQSGLTDAVAEVIGMALAHRLELDVRTTVHRKLLSEADLRQMGAELQALSVPVWTLQQFHQVEMIDDDLAEEATYGDRELVNLARSLGGFVRVRGLAGLIL